MDEGRLMDGLSRKVMRNRAIVALGVYLGWYVFRGLDPWELPRICEILPKDLQYNLRLWVDKLNMSANIGFDRIKLIEDDKDELKNKFLEELSKITEKEDKGNTLAAFVRENAKAIVKAVKAGKSWESVVEALREVVAEEYREAITVRRLKMTLTRMGYRLDVKRKARRKVGRKWDVEQKDMVSAIEEQMDMVLVDEQECDGYEQEEQDVVSSPNRVTFGGISGGVWGRGG